MVLSAPAALAVAAARYLTDREHGSELCKVPLAWRAHNRLRSVYSLSSFAFCVAGVYITVLLRAYPWRSLYSLHILEGPYWIWTGFISFACDAVDLGIPSWTHPLDRTSATFFLLFNVVEYIVSVVLGTLPTAAIFDFPIGLGISLYFFKLSAEAVHRKDMHGFFFWHAAWHFSLTIAVMLHFALIVFAP